MRHCPKLGPIVELSHYNGNYKSYEEYLYGVFKADLYNRKVFYKNKPVSLKRFPEQLGKEFSFYHLTCKNFNHTGNEEDREPDLRRCERLHWIKPSIETNHLVTCNQQCFVAYIKRVRNKDRVHLLNKEDRYMIVLEEREDYYLLVTAYYIEHENTLRRKISESEELYK